MSALVDAYDMVGFDLDGVIYRGPDPVPYAAETIAELRRRGVRVGFVTNNAQRAPQAVADHLERLGIPCCIDDVITSAQATARIMAEALPRGAEVLIVGSQALADEITQVGLTPVWHRSASTAAIVLGFDATLTWEAFNQACYAVQHGAIYYACNDDLTRPTDQGIAVGMGGMLAAIRTALPDVDPIMGGKPARPLLDECRRRLGGTRPLFVGDRLDTDIEGAVNAGWDSLFVLSGAHTMLDLAVAPPHQHPTYIGEDLRALLQEPRRA